MARRSIVLSCILTAVATLFSFQISSATNENPGQISNLPSDAVGPQPQIAIGGRHWEALQKKPPLDDFGLLFNVPKGYQIEASVWINKEKTFYTNLLAKGKYDLLVVPFQVQEFAIDLPERSLMTAILAKAITESQNVSIPDPYLVARALGEGERRYKAENVRSLAQKLGVKRIVWGYVGHDLRYQMRLTIQYQDRQENGYFSDSDLKITTQDLGKQAFSDEFLPIDVFGKALPEVLKILDIDSKAITKQKQIAQFRNASLPATPLDMVRDDVQPARDAYYFQILAALSPRRADRERERFLEKSLLSVLEMSPESPDYKVLKARALMGLGYRPAALKVLGTPSTAEQKHLLAMLNGNLTEIDGLASKLQPDTRGLTSKLERNQVKASYGLSSPEKSNTAASTLKLPGKVWPYFVARAMTDWNDWAQFENVQLKVLLDHELPLKSYSAEEMVRGALSIGNTDKVRQLIDVSVIEHVQKSIDSEASIWCCQKLSGHVTKLDYFDFIEALSTDNLMRRARFYTSVQGSPESAIDFLSKIEPVYKDNPSYVTARAKAEYAAAMRADGANKEGLLSSAYKNAFNGFFWSEEQTLSAADARMLIRDVRLTERDSLGNIYETDYPYRPEYAVLGFGERPAVMFGNTQSVLANSTYQFELAKEAHAFLSQGWSQNEIDESFIKFIEGRFIGHPLRTRFLADSAERRGDLKEAERHYREIIKSQPSYWDAYISLGTLLFKSGDMENSAKLFMSYPGFKKGADEHPVYLSNYAYETGSMFYWSGYLKQAAPLYQIAADLDTGSAASISGQVRVDLIQKKYGEAADGLLQRARRYNDKYGYRDYLGLLHVMGNSNMAWDAFNTLEDQPDMYPIWETALVGQRLQGMTEEQIAEWANQESIRHNLKHISNMQANYLVMAGITDRKPSVKLAARIEEIEQPVMKLFESISRGKSAEGYDVPIGQIESDSSEPTIVTEMPKPTRIKSDLVLFAAGYNVLRNGEFQAAEKLLKEAVTTYQVRNLNFGYLLPYYAFAASKAGKTETLEALLSKFSAEERLLDYYLSKAVVSGLAGKTEESLGFLKLARHTRPWVHTEKRPVYVDYQYAEITEWLYKMTGEKKYRDVALDWVKQYQLRQPWFAWAYAMEAKLSTNPEERGRAIAIANHLDPDSERLGSLPKAETQAAIKKYGRLNSFFSEEAPKVRSAI
jgi:tetratricopeptide (TPR) repeat protein